MEFNRRDLFKSIGAFIVSQALPQVFVERSLEHLFVGTRTGRTSSTTQNLSNFCRGCSLCQCTSMGTLIPCFHCGEVWKPYTLCGTYTQLSS